jgi:hypothetical protein
VGFGDADKQTLIAARTGIYRIRVNAPGIWPERRRPGLRSA